VKRRPRVRLLAVGGTISCTPREGTQGVAAELTAADIASSVPGLSDIAEIDVGDVTTVASFAITVRDMRDLADAIERAFGEGCDGVVVTHGTDTIEETAYALALMLPRTRRVALTGAMRNPSLPGTDGPANLLAAFLVAGRSDLALGPVVVMNDEIHTARFVTKLHATRISAIGSPGAGPVGEIVEQRVHVWYQPAYEDYLGLPPALEGASVELVRIAVDPDPGPLRDVTARRPAGIVLEGTGGGHVPPSLLPALDEAIDARIPVIVATRCSSGRTLASTYGMPGGEVDLRRRGVIAAGLLSGQKARLRLIVGQSLGFAAPQLFPVE
jgi:L-asparaginase